MSGKMAEKETIWEITHPDICILHIKSRHALYYAMHTFDKVYKLLYLITSFTVQVFCTVSLPVFVSSGKTFTSKASVICIYVHELKDRGLEDFILFYFALPFWSTGLHSHDINQFGFRFKSYTFRISIVIAFSRLMIDKRNAFLSSHNSITIITYLRAD